jgi:hypothetical protein
MNKIEEKSVFFFYLINKNNLKISYKITHKINFKDLIITKIKISIEFSLIFNIF